MGTIRNPRRHPHVAETIDYLRHCGADAIESSQGKRIRIAWRHDDKHMAIALPIATGNLDTLVAIGRQLVRRRYRQDGIEVRP